VGVFRAFTTCTGYLIHLDYGRRRIFSF
jgi:hypothetical protein